MSKKIEIKVYDPCHENWNLMTPEAQGRFCQSCEKVVTDFSVMTDKEILAYLTEKNVNLCGRFSNDQLNRKLNAPPSKKFSWVYAVNMAIAGIFSSGSAHAQACPPPEWRWSPMAKASATGKQLPSTGQTDIICRVYDSADAKKVLTVFAKYKDNDEVIKMEADGSFRIPVKNVGRTVVVSALGYKDEEYTIVAGASSKVNLYMVASDLFKIDPTLFNNIQLDSLQIPLTGTVGIMISYEHIDTTEKISRKVKDIIPEVIRKKDITIYPNPIIAGRELKMSVDIKYAGEYTVEVLDGNGRIMYLSKTYINTKTQIVSINTNESWAKGVYWIRVVGADSKKVYSSKLVIR